MIVGAPLFDNERGKVYVYSNAGILLWEMEGENSEDSFGYSVSSAGDVDVDGLDDVIIGASWFANGRGKVYIRKGLNGGFITAIEGENLWDHFGSSVSSAGNIDNSYGDDVIIGAPMFDDDDNKGKAYVYSGISPPPYSGTLIWEVEGENYQDFFGYSVSGSPS